MAVRRPNKNATSSSTRKPTVAGRRKPLVERGDAEVVEPATGAGEPTADVETSTVESPDVESPDIESPDVEKPGETPADESAEAGAAEPVDVDTEAATPADDFVSVDEPAAAEPTTEAGAESEAAATTQRASLVKAAERTDAPEPDADDAPTVVKPSGKARRPVSRVSTIKADAARAPAKEAKATEVPADAATGRFGGAVAGVGQWGKRMSTPSTSGASSFVSAKSAVRLAVAAVVIGLIALVLAFTPGASIGPNKAFINQAATDELMSQARSKLCLPVAVTSKDFDKWAGQARAVLVGTALKNFNDYLPTQKQLIEQSKLVADCRVDSIGVRELTLSDDGDSAKVLANILVSQNLGEQLLNSAAVRVDYTMRKQGDQWMISGVDPF